MASVTLCFSSLNEPELTALLYILSHEQQDHHDQPASDARRREQHHNGGRAGAHVHKMGAGFEVTTYPLAPASAMIVTAKFDDFMVTGR